MTTDALAAFAQRLAHACEEAGLPPRGRQTRIARALNISQQAVRKWLDGLTWPEMQRAIDLADLLKVNVTWLLQGHGPMRGERIDQNALALVEALVNLPKQERAHVASYLSFEFHKLPQWFAEEQRARYDAALQAVAALPEVPTKQTPKKAA
jgi:transcriptional regulator with XRE-family HTH domain